MGEAGFHILAPAKDALGEDVNEEGMVVELNYRSFRGLFTGDAGEPTEKAILNRLRDVDFFFKVGHHGSRYSSCQEFLDQVKAEIAVISCSDSIPMVIRLGNNTPPEKIQGQNRIYHEKRGNHCVQQTERECGQKDL